MSRRAIARREFSALSREKTIVLALVIQLVIAGFSSFLVVGLTSLYDPGSVEGDGVTVGISGETQDRLVTVADETENVDPERYENASAAREDFRAGTIDAVVTGRTVDTGSGSRIQIDAVAPAEDFRTTMIVVTLREYLTAVEDAERDARASDIEFQPLGAPEESGGGNFFGFTYTILLPLLLFLPPFISGSIAVDSITEELERGTFELLRVAPISLVEIIDGKAAAMWVLAPVQALLWIGLLRFNGFGVSNLIPLVLLVGGITGLTVAIGVALSLATSTRRQAQLLYSVVVLSLFGIATVLPEHPASTVAKLAADSATPGTYLHVAAFVVVAVFTYALVRWNVGRLDSDAL